MIVQFTQTVGNETAKPLDSSVQLRTGITRDKRQFWLISGAIIVVVAYSLPFLDNYVHHRPAINVAVEDEKIYLARVMDAYRGGNLSNPYIAEHQNANRFMPEMAERVLASAAHITRLSPLLVVRIARVLFPALIYFVLWSLACGLDLEPRLAMLAGIMPPLLPSISWISSSDVPGTGFLRYFRAISPAFYVLVLLFTLRVVHAVWKKPSWWTTGLAGASIAILFYVTPIYYWSFAFAGTCCLTVFALVRTQRMILVSVAIAFVGALPFLLKSMHQEHLAEIKDTLRRLDLLTPGRAPDVYVPHVFILGILILVSYWLSGHRFKDSARFLLPFMGIGTLLTVQNVVTNSHLQGYHWVECLIPMWCLAFSALIHNSGRAVRPFCLLAFVAVIGSGAIFLQIAAYDRCAQARQQNPEFWALDTRMPRTLNWLNGHTSINSVVIADTDVMDSLVLFTHNKVYWADYASQHVISEQEVEMRKQSLASWRPWIATPLPFAANFYLGTRSNCVALAADHLLYINKNEATCVLGIPGNHDAVR